MHKKILMVLVILIALVIAIQMLLPIKLGVSQQQLVDTYYPTGYAPLGQTAYVSGALADLISDNGAYMTFRSYQTATSPQTLYAHQETTTIAGVSYYLQKLVSADGPATDLSASTATTGRQLLGKFVYPLTGVSSIPASTWTMYYRAWHSPVTVDVATNSPSSTSGPWTDPTNAYADGSGSAYTSTDNAQQVYGGYGFAIPSDATITKVRVRLDTWSATSEKIKLYMSNDNGTSWLATTYLSAALPTSETEIWVDVTTWTTWTPSNINNDKIRSKVENVKVGAAGRVDLDWIPIEVSYGFPPAAHADIDILVRASDGTIRNTIATDVAGSANLTTTAATLSGSYSWSAYSVVDQTDYLEIDYYIDVVLAKSGVTAYLRIDDSTLTTANQTRATNILLPNEYTTELEFTGSSNTYAWSQLVWTVDSAWTTGSIAVTLQLYNYAAGAYPTSGDGYIAYTSANANTDETKTQTITTNPTNFRDASGNWKIKITGVKTTLTQFDFKADLISYEVTKIPPVASFTFTPSYPIAGESVLFDATSSTPNGGTIVSYEWNFGDGNITIVSDPTITHVYASYGTFPVTLNVTDSEGLWDTESKTVPVRQYPTADADGPYYGYEGSPITFNAGNSAPNGGTITLYEWDWNNDGVYDESTTSSSIPHTWTDDFTGVVGLRVTDSEGLTATATASVTVANVAPTVNAGPDQAANEGATVSFSGSFTDPGAGDTHTYLWDFGDGTTTTGTLTPTHAYADNGIYTVTLTVTDDDGGVGTDTLSVTVSNVAPTVNAGPDQVANEGATVSFSGSFTDPGAGDTHTYLWNFGDGATATGTLTPTHAYGDDGTYTVTLTVTDDDGGVGTDTLQIIINNVAPTVNAGPDQITNEGSIVSFSGSFTDPGWLDTHSILWNFGDGGTAIGTLMPTHVYADNGAYTVTLTVTDDDGAVGTDSLLVTVNNVAPTVNAGPDQTANEGSAVSFSGSFTDPGAADTHTILWDFGDGSTATGTLTPTHAYTDNGIYTVTLTITDDDGGIGTDMLTVTVNNVAPTVNAGPDQTANEGATVSFSGSFTDPGAGDTHTFFWDFGDGGTAAGTLTPTHAYADNGLYTVTLTVTDDDGGVGTDTLLVTVYNVAPTVNAGPDQTADEGSVVSFTGSFIDPGNADTHTFFWDFGDGTSAAGTLTPTHAYGDNGVYTVTLTVTDDDGGVGTDTLLVTVNNVAPTVNAGLDQIANEGATVSFSGSFTDPGTLDTHTIFWEFGDGATAIGILNPTHAYGDNGIYTVTLKVTDDDGGIGIDTLVVTLNNVPPTVNAGPDQTANEGSTLSFSGSFTDPGWLDTHTMLWDFGDGTSAAGTLTPTHAYGDNGVYTVTLTVTDDDGGIGTDTLTVTVNNVAPTAEAGPDQTVYVGQTVYFHGSAIDPGWLDTLTYTWDFDATNGIQVDAIGQDVTHVYSVSGSYIVTLTVTDDDGGVSTDTLTVTVLEVPHDVAVLSVTPSDTKVYEGNPFNITVVVKNEGTVAETFEVSVYAYNVTYSLNYTVGTQSVTLEAGETKTLTFPWDTKTVRLRTVYTIEAKAFLPTDFDLSDNTLTDGTVYVRLMGDVNDDGIVDVFDLIKVGIAFGSKPGDPRWNPDADLNNDGIIDVFDLIKVGINFGRKAP